MFDKPYRPAIRKFETMAAVRALDGFRDDNPVDKSNYKDLLGHTDFADPEKCCLRKPNGELCQHAHKLGWVVLLSDKSSTIIGNVCAAKHFDADAKFSRDTALYENERRRQEGLARLQELLSAKDDDLASLRELRDALKALQIRTQSFSDGVGEPCAGKLKAMMRDGRRDVIITGTRIRPYWEDNVKKEELTKIAITVGNLSGLSIFRAAAFVSIFDRINAIVRAYKKAEELADTIKNRDLDHLRATLTDSPMVAADSAALFEAEKSFLRSDVDALPFLVNKPTDRQVAARFVLSLGGHTASKDKARDWLLARDQQLKSQYGVDRLDALN